MQKQDRHRLDTQIMDLFAQRGQVSFVQRCLNLTRRQHTFRGLEP